MKAPTVWRFTPDEFAWVWAETGHVGRYPEPISLIETPTSADDYERIRRDVSARYPHGDPDRSGPLQVLLEPDLRIVCYGQAPDSAHRVRSVGAAIGALAVVLFQSPSSTAEFGGDLQLVVTRRGQLGKHIAATMPEVAPGKLGRLAGYAPRVCGDEQFASWVLDAKGQLPVEEQIRRLLRAPRATEGFLRVEQYLRDRRPPGPTYLSWIDVSAPAVAAGRYLVDFIDTDTVFTPASAETIAAALSDRAELDSH